MQDDEERKVLARIRAAEKRLRATPPTCLSGFKASPSGLRGVIFDGHGSNLNKIYHLSCSCGRDSFFVLGHVRESPLNQEPIFVSPLALKCASCEKVMELIDTDKHGFNGEMGASSTIRGTGRRTAYDHDQCGVQPFTIHVRFEHSSETLEDSTGHFTGREQDFFSWFSLIGKCDKCKTLLHLTDFECA